MRIAHITFRLLFGLFVFCMPQAYGVSLLDADFSASYHSRFLAHCATSSCPYGLPAEYTEAMKVYEDTAPLSFDKEKCEACRDHLKNRMGKQQAWRSLLVKGYVRLHVNEALPQKIHVPKELRQVMETYVEKEDDYQAIEKTVLQWALDGKKWTFISEWLEEGINDPALCTDIGFLKAHATSIYTYGNNFFNQRLLKWLTKKKQWTLPADAEIEYYDVKAYKMRYIQLLFNEDQVLSTQELNAFLASASKTNTDQQGALLRLEGQLFENGGTLRYDLQCVHILNKYTRGKFDFRGNAKKWLYCVRDKRIAKGFYILLPLSYFSIIHWWIYRDYAGNTAGDDVVSDLYHSMREIAERIVLILGFIFIMYFGYYDYLRRNTMGNLKRDITLLETEQIPCQRDDLAFRLSYDNGKDTLHSAEALAQTLVLLITKLEDLLPLLGESALKEAYQERLLAAQEELRVLERRISALKEALDAEDEAEKADKPTPSAKKIDHYNEQPPNTSHFWELLGSWLVLMLCFFGVWGGTLLWTKRNEGHDL